MSKSIAKNAVFNMGHNAVLVVFPLVTSTYVARTLGATGVGVVSSAQNLITYFTMIATLGIPSYGVNYISRDFMTSLISCALLVVLVKMVKLFVPIHSNLLLLFVEVIVGVVGYLAGLLVLKNNKCYMILKKIHIIK